MKRSFFLGLLLQVLWFTGSVNAQSAFVQSDRIFYAVGERVGVACKVPVNGAAIRDVVIKWELFQGVNKVAVQFFTKLEENGWSGFDFYLPYDLSTGSYFLRGSVSDQLQHIELFSLPLSIVNPSLKWDENLLFKASENNFLEKVEQSWIDIIQGDQKELIQLSEVKGLTLLTLTIAEAETNRQPNVTLSSLPVESWSTTANWSRDIWFYGTTLKHKKPTAVNIIGIYANEMDTMLMTRSNNDGLFKIFVNPFTGSRHFQPIAFGDHKHEYEYLPFTPSLQQIGISGEADSAAIAYYQLSQIRQSVNTYFSIYNPVKKENDILPPRSELKSQKTYKIANYNKFDLLRDFCRENDSPLKFKEKENKWTAEFLIPGAYAKKFNAVTKNPLIIVNGQLAINDHRVSSLKTKDIEQMDLYYDLEQLRSRYSVFGTEGVVKIKSGGKLDCWETKEQNEIFNVQGLLTKEISITELIGEKVAKGLRPILEPCLLFATHPINSQMALHRGDEHSAYRIFGIFMDENGKLFKAESMLNAKYK